MHLTLNLPVVLRYLNAKLFKKPSPQTQLPIPATGKKLHAWLPVGKALALCTSLALMFFLGTRHAEQPTNFHQQAATSGPVDAVIRYHAFSSETRTSVFRGAPSVEWGTPPPEFKRYPDLPQNLRHLLENLRLAGHKAGLQARPLAQFDEAVCAQALGIDGIEEGVLAMLALRPNDLAACRPMGLKEISLLNCLKFKRNIRV